MRSVRYTNREDPGRVYGVELSREGATFFADGHDIVMMAGRADPYPVTEDHPLDALGIDGEAVERLIGTLKDELPGRHIGYDGKPKGARITELPHREMPEKSPINELEPAYEEALETFARQLAGESTHPLIAETRVLPFQIAADRAASQ